MQSSSASFVGVGKDSLISIWIIPRGQTAAQSPSLWHFSLSIVNTVVAYPHGFCICLALEKISGNWYLMIDGQVVEDCQTDGLFKA